jgi:hypothetical protein
MGKECLRALRAKLDCDIIEEITKIRKHFYYYTQHLWPIYSGCTGIQIFFAFEMREAG